MNFPHLIKWFTHWYRIVLYFFVLMMIQTQQIQHETLNWFLTLLFFELSRNFIENEIYLKFRHISISYLDQENILLFSQVNHISAIDYCLLGIIQNWNLPIELNLIIELRDNLKGITSIFFSLNEGFFVDYDRRIKHIKLNFE